MLLPRFMNGFLRKWGLSLKVLWIALFILLVKVIANIFGFEPFTNNPLLSSVIGGMTFLIGFILAGTLTDYKESEKLPGEIVSSLENIYEEGRYLKQLNYMFDFDKLNNILDKIVDDLKGDLQYKRRKMAIHTVSTLSEVILQAEKLGLPAVWISRIKTEQSALKKNIFRMYHIKQTQFIPAAYAIVDIMVFIIITLLVLLKFERFYEGLLMTTIISYIFIYMTMLIKDIDDPFDLSAKGYADINLYMFDAFKKRVGN